MKGNVGYQKTDFGSETPDLLNKYVLKITQICRNITQKRYFKREFKACFKRSYTCIATC